MQIGELAKEAGVNTQTIRFYERRGLLKAPARTQAGYRAYSPNDVQIVQFIRQSKELGYTLAEIKELLKLHDENTDTAHAKTLAVAKIANINEQIERLKQMRNSLEIFVSNCSCGTELQPDCGAITQLDFTVPCS